MNPYQDLSDEINDPLEDADVTKPIPGVEAQPSHVNAEPIAPDQTQQPGQGAFPPASVAMSGGPYEPYEPPPSQGPSKLVIGIAIAGLTLAGLGVAKSVFFPSKEKPKPKAQATGYFAEQQRMMREAIDMAKEAQHMQKMHMEEMRQAMEEDAYYAEYGERRSGGNDDW